METTQKTWRRGMLPPSADAEKFICDLYAAGGFRTHKNLLESYNAEAKKHPDWRVYNSTGSIRNVLRKAGIAKQIEPQLEETRVGYKCIYLPYELRMELVQLFKTCLVTVNKALAFNSTMSRTQRIIRAAAMQRGGVIYEAGNSTPKYVPECATNIDNVTGNMEFIFYGRVILTWYKVNKSAQLFTPDKTDEFADIVTIDQLMDLQVMAELTAKSYLIN